MERHVADCTVDFRLEDKVETERCAEVEVECGQAMYIARET